MKCKLFCLLLCLCCSLACPDGFRIDWGSANAGAGVVQSGALSLASSVGQTATGFVLNAQCLHWIGFWSDDVRTPVAPGSICGVKSLPDGAYVAIVGKVATTSAGDFAALFYIQEQDRTSGLLVVTPLSSAEIARGSIVNVIGTLGTTLSGERFVTGSIVAVAGSIVNGTSIANSTDR